MLNPPQDTRTECSAALFVDASIRDVWPDDSIRARMKGDFNFLAFKLTDRIKAQYYRTIYGPLPDDKMSDEDAEEPKDVDMEQGDTMEKKSLHQHASGEMQPSEDISMGCISETEPDSHGNDPMGDRNTLPVALAASFNIIGGSSTCVCIHLIPLRSHRLT